MRASIFHENSCYLDAMLIRQSQVRCDRITTIGVHFKYGRICTSINFKRHNNGSFIRSLDRSVVHVRMNDMGMVNDEAYLVFEKIIECALS